MLYFGARGEGSLSEECLVGSPEGRCWLRYTACRELQTAAKTEGARPVVALIFPLNMGKRDTPGLVLCSVFFLQFQTGR